ncbi:MAG: DUF2126 domain-containing protein, partial [Verrucomicrobiales bacterium]
MAISAAIHHVTEYRYDRPVSLGPQTVRLRPAPHSRTPITSYSLRISPPEHFINWQQDPHGNYLARIVFPEKVEHFRIEVDLLAELEVYNPFDFFLEPDAEEYPLKYAAELRSELVAYLDPPVDVGPNFAKLVSEIDRRPRLTMDFFVELNSLLEKKIKYLVRMEPGVQTPEETLEKGSGSCRDNAWLMVNLLRELGFAGRFVSGYLIQLKPDEKSLDGPSGTEVDFTDLHAWAEVYLPGAGWVGMDGTSGLLTAEGHIPVACTPTPAAAAPLTGGLSGDPEVEFEFSMEVARIDEKPRVTLPYSDRAWERVNRLGELVDKKLSEGDVRLTMGGEPTFVSIDDRDGEEWNTSAVGVRKRMLSGEMLTRLSSKFAPGGLLHFGQGKWYPGESLPRWCFTCFWRPDGEKLWHDPSLLADLEKDYGFGQEEANAFLCHLAGVLGVRSEHILPAHEDAWYYLWREKKLPSNVDPLDNRLEDPEERTRIANLFDRGLSDPKGWVLPLQSQPEQEQMSDAGNKGGWQSGAWALRRDELFLIPGDSPIGLRLPLESLPWVHKDEYPYIEIVDPMTIDPSQRLPSTRAALERYEEMAQDFTFILRSLDPDSDAAMAERRHSARPSLRVGGSDKSTVRTAICIEPRDGKLFAFLPPVTSSADYFDLIAAIEVTAKALKMPIILEGERPPADPRIERFSIAPDPGVLEINVHPAASWKALVDINETVYEEARLARLSTEKFLVDGRHTGTGGGNHIVVGGASPADSPFLRRPDLLRSMLAYWHHHPSLSFLFSGLFIGPTSQSPRIDEARDDALYEMEIAFAEIDRQQAMGGTPPELIDRILRHLLTDATGNTHRAEFCIDKLFSPDSPTGRLGLLELRSFEMPPHVRMSLAQQLLIRACIAWFWEKPFSPRKLTRWGPALHDRFMLPHFVWQDFCDVLGDLRDEAGFAFEEEWFRAHFEFRFPFFGKVAYRDTSIEVRGALEPWHVLGEEGMASGTVRFVDSSVERLQVRVQGFPPDRYLVTCNGRRLPLTATGVAGESVAGVRFRAWQPQSCLHPTLPPDAPLYID